MKPATYLVGGRAARGGCRDRAPNAGCVEHDARRRWSRDE